MKRIEDKKDPSLRGSLIRLIAEHILPYSYWKDTTLTPFLQSVLNSNLNFEIKVTDAEIRGDYWVGCEVYFIDENNIPKVTSLTVGRDMEESIIEAKYKIGEKVRFNHLEEGIREGVIFGTYNLKGKLKYSIRDHSGLYATNEAVLYTMYEDEIIEKIS